MVCPKCGASDQEGLYCGSCGARLDGERRRGWRRFFGPGTGRTWIVFFAGLAFALAVFLGISIAQDRSLPQNLQTVQVSNNPYAESEAVKKLRTAKPIDPDPNLPQDSVVGYWQRYHLSGSIDKMDEDYYRWFLGDRVFAVRFNKDHYQVTADEERYYDFAFKAEDEWGFLKAYTKRGKAVKEPDFSEGFSVFRVGPDGRLTRAMRINRDAFALLGQTYGEIAGTYGPGALTVINGDQYIVFRGDGGNVALQFSGDTVPLASEAGRPWHLTPLSEVKDEGAGGAGGLETADPQPPAKESKEAEPPSQKDRKVKIPDPATFPATNAVATGAVWADLGFFVDGCPPTLSLDDLGKLLNVDFETGRAGAISGYHFYGMEDGYFAATVTMNGAAYKVSGYGDHLDRAKTRIFIERQ